MKKFYGIAVGDIIGVSHIMSVMFYCNFDEHSFIFSGSFRKNSRFETDEILKKKHSHYYWWAKNLRECIEAFGITMEDSDIPVFYHGISKSLLFSSTDIRINGPISTTSGLLYYFYYLPLHSYILYL